MNKTLNIILLIIILSVISCKEKKENQSVTEKKTERINTEKKKTNSEKEQSEKLVKSKIQNKTKNEIFTKIDPFHSGDLYDNFNQNQIGFSYEFLKIETEHYKKISTEVTSEVSNYQFDLKKLFETGKKYQNGILGVNYKRIKVYITSTKKIDKSSFLLVGKTDVNGNVSHFDGKIEIISIYELKNEFDYEGQGELFAKYTLYENPNDKYSGVFKGLFECSIIINHKKRIIEFDDAWMIADGYANRTYVGTWTNNKTKKKKNCIWGDYRLPFTFDFDQGDGEMMINKKYLNNGWKSFNNQTE